jgi:hypothetical protein
VDERQREDRSVNVAARALPYDLIDLETGLTVGQLTAAGEVVAGSADVRERVARAFRRELIVKDGELVEELGVCFAGVEVLRPGDPNHAATVVRNLGRLAGLLPCRRHGEGKQ